MSRIHRTKKETNFTVMDNGFLDRKDLSFGAKGMLAHILTKPDDWTIFIYNLVNSSTNGKGSVQRLMRELERNGYVNRKQKSGGDRKWIYESQVFEHPSDNPLFDDGKSLVDQKLIGEKHASEKHIDEKPRHILSTNSTKDNNINNIIKDTDKKPNKQENKQVDPIPSKTKTKPAKKKKQVDTSPRCNGKSGRGQCKAEPTIGEYCQKCHDKKIVTAKFKALMAAYEAELPYPIGNYGKETKAASRILKMGYTPEQAIDCYRWLKTAPENKWWHDKNISLTSIVTQIGPYTQQIKEGKIDSTGKQTNNVDSDWQFILAQSANGANNLGDRPLAKAAAIKDGLFVRLRASTNEFQRGAIKKQFLANYQALQPLQSD